MDTFHSHGKFLISGEYLILHGASGLTLPLPKMKQSLHVQTASTPEISWEAFDEQGDLWLTLNDSELLKSILSTIQKKKPELFTTGLSFTTRMNFSRHWGLGSSSTLIANLAQWSGVDRFELQQQFFQGSGYDVAAARENGPFLYQLVKNEPLVTPVQWEPSFKQHLRFVYLGQKKNSREAMRSFMKKWPTPESHHIQSINELTQNFLKAKTIDEFSRTIYDHEEYMAALLGLTPIQKQLFESFPGAIKSLGAWGGDFVMAVSHEDSQNYFKQKGFPLSFQWDELI